MTQQEILETLAAKQITVEQASKLLAQLNQKPLYCKVSAKGALSVYGLQRMPVSLYREQWERLAGFMPTILQFVKDNADKLSTKADKKAAA